MRLGYKIVSLLFLFSNIVNSQNSIENNFIREYLIPLKQYKIETINKRKTSLKDVFLFNYIECQLEKFENGEISLKTFENANNEKQNSKFKTCLLKINKGDFYLGNNPAKAIEAYEEAYNISKYIKSDELSCEILKRLCSYFSSTQNNEHIKLLENSIFKYENHIYDDFEKVLYEQYKLIYRMQLAYSDGKLPIKSDFYNLIKLAKKTNYQILIGDAYQLLGAYYLVFEQNQDSTSHYHLLAKEKFYSESNANFYKSKYDGIRLNLIKNAIKNGDLEKLKTDLNKIEPGQGFRIRLSRYQFLKETYLELGDYKNAFLTQTLEKQINDSLRHLEALDIHTKHEVERKDQENLKLKKDKQNLLIGATIILLFLVIIAFLIQKNTRKKQKLAEQEKVLETQKLATVLKEQELVNIDAMIEGQEKERQRIANDLHDDLGGLMATVKLHFNALKDKQTPELFDKTTTLLDEAYHKVRSIAHAKNSGVIAKQGLLKAVQNMADKISASNKITVDVIDHGLENRLENSLELTIFRIIQELLTNVIKHAEATEATIHLTNHEDTLNIMIEDNGKGFNPNQVTTKNKGMGISSIDKRVAHLNGTLTIESEPKKGTTIIIDIPI